MPKLNLLPVSQQPYCCQQPRKAHNNHDDITESAVAMQPFCCQVDDVDVVAHTAGKHHLPFTPIYYTSNERDHFSLSTDIFNFMNRYRSRKWYMKKYSFIFYFLVVHISTNNLLYGLTLEGMLITFMSRELCLRFLVFILCQKTGNF